MARIHPGWFVGHGMAATKEMVVAPWDAGDNIAAFAQARRRRRAVCLLRAGMDVAAPALDPGDTESSALQAVHEAFRRSRPHPPWERLLPIAQESQLLQELLRAGSCR